MVALSRSINLLVLIIGLGMLASGAAPAWAGELTVLSFENIMSHPSPITVGIMLPSSPDTYAQYTTVMRNEKQYKLGAFTYTLGIIDRVRVVLSSPPPIGSFSLTAIDTYLMEKIFRPSLLIDPGTAGSHLSLLSMGDVVIGARVVNFSNFMSRANGSIVPGQFSALVSDNEGYTEGNPNPEYIYADPRLVDLAYSAAQRVATYTPAEILHAFSGRVPWVMKYGTQGSGAAWLRNVNQIRESTKIFHEVDEAGNYPIALVSSVNKIPFIEIHTISDAAINVPTKMDKYFHECSVYAQQRSNRIVLEMIHEIANNLHEYAHLRATGGFSDPFQKGVFAGAVVAPKYVVLWAKKNGIDRG